MKGAGLPSVCSDSQQLLLQLEGEVRIENTAGSWVGTITGNRVGESDGHYLMNVVGAWDYTGCAASIHLGTQRDEGVGVIYPAEVHAA